MTAHSANSRSMSPSRTIELEFNGRFTDVHTITHTF